MKKPRSIKRIGLGRRLAGLLLLILGLLVAGVWLGSAWYTALGSGSTTVDVAAGEVTMTTPNPFGNLAYSSFDPEVWQLIEPDGRRAAIRWRVDLSQWAKTPTHDFWVYGSVEFPDSSEGTGIPTTIRAFVLWPIPFLLWIPAVLLVRSGIVARWRAVTGKCWSCGYDLAGTPRGAPCPECGKGGETK